jgi:hypothetical protein
LRRRVSRISASVVQGRKCWSSTTCSGSDSTKIPEVFVDRLSPHWHLIILFILGSFLGMPDPPVLIPCNEFLQASGFPSLLDECGVQQLLRCRTLLRVFAQTLLNKLLERGGEVAFQNGRWILGDEKEDLHGVDIGVRRLAVCQLQRGNAQRPDIRLAVVTRLLDNLRRHPKRGSHERVLLGHRCRKLAGNAKVSKLDLAARADKDVGRCIDVSRS